jgi:hypothetical protein
MTTTAQPPLAPEGYKLKKSKPIYKRVWFLALLAVVAIAIIASASAGGSDSSGSASGSGTGTGVAVDAPAADAPPADDPLSDGGWTAADIQVERSQFGDSITARVTNTEDSAQTGIFTLTVFGPDGTRIGEAMGSANEVEAGQTSTVTFLSSSTDSLPGDPATWTYELQNDL